MSNPIGLTAGQSFNPYGLFVGVSIPQALASNPRISPGAKLVYGRLARYAGHDGDCYPAVETLGREVGLGERQTQRYLKELETAGFIQIIERFKGPKVHDTNAYVFLWHESLFDSVRKGIVTPPLVSDVTPLLPSEMTPPLVSDVTPKESHSEESQLKESLPPLAELAIADAPFPETISDPPFAPPPEPGYTLEPPRVPLSADQRLIKATAKFLYDHHPINRRGSLARIETALRDISKAGKRPVPVLMEFVRKQHSRWLDCSQWKRDRVNALSGWLEGGMWRDEPPHDRQMPPSTPSNPRSRYVDITDGLPVSV